MLVQLLNQFGYPLGSIPNIYTLTLLSSFKYTCLKSSCSTHPLFNLEFRMSSEESFDPGTSVPALTFHLLKLQLRYGTWRWYVESHVQRIDAVWCWKAESQQGW